MRKVLLVSALAGLALAVGFATPASAADSTVTVTVEATDGLSITVPTTSTLSGATGSPGGNITGQLGAVTVTDERALLDSTWTVTVSATDFITGTAPLTPAETIVNDNVVYWSGAATATTGNATPAPGQPAVGDAEDLGAPTTAFSLTGGIGDNTATWNPTLVIAVGAGNIAGAYAGTVTHTVL